MAIDHQFALGQRVIVDGDPTNVMMVIGVIYRPGCEPEFDCSYWHGGDHKVVWMPAWRLSKSPTP